MIKSAKLGIVITVLVSPAIHAAETAAQLEMQASQSETATAAELADRLMPNDPLINSLLNAYETRFLADWKKDDGDAIEVEYPGLYLASLAAGKNVYRKALVENLHPLKAQFTQHLQSRLSSAEIEKLNSFFKSETGVRVLAAVVGALPNGGTREQIEARAKDELRNTVTAADTAAIMQFSETSAFATIKQLRVDFRPTIAAWHSAVIAKAWPLIETGIEATVQSHIDKLNGNTQ